MPSQFRSVKVGSGRSVASGWTAGSAGAQSVGGRNPSPSASSTYPVARVPRNVWRIAWFPARSRTGFDVVRRYVTAGFAEPSGDVFSTSLTMIVLPDAAPTEPSR